MKSEISCSPYFTILAKPTGRCNLDCVFCYQNANNMPRGPRLSSEVLEILIQRVCEHPSPVLNLEWIGGEALIVGIDFYRRSEDLINKFRRDGTSITCPIQTNGTLLNAGWVDFLGANPRYRLSIGFEIIKPLQNSLRLGHGVFSDSYTIVANNLLMLREAGIPFGVLSLIELETLEIPPEEWLEAVVGHGIRKIGLQLSYQQIYSGDLAKVQRYINWLDRLFAAQAEYNSNCPSEKRVTIRESYYLYNLIRQAGIRYGSCHNSPVVCSDFLISVGEDGRVYGYCDSFMGVREEEGEDYAVGSIMVEDFATILASPKMQKIRQALTTGREKCRPCSYFDLCRGGCGFFKRLGAGSISAGFGDPIESYCAINIALLSYVTDPELAGFILRSYDHLNNQAKLPGYFLAA
jgi:uncharacterized protein